MLHDMEEHNEPRQDDVRASRCRQRPGRHLSAATVLQAGSSFAILRMPTLRTPLSSTTGVGAAMRFQPWTR